MRKDSFVFAILILWSKMAYGQTIFNRDERSLLNLNKSAIHAKLISRNYELDMAQSLAADTGKVYSFYRKNIKKEDDFYIIMFASKYKMYPISITHNLSNNKRFLELKNSFTKKHSTKGKTIKGNGCTVFTASKAEISNKICTVRFSTCNYTLPYRAGEVHYIIQTHSCEILIEN